MMKRASFALTFGMVALAVAPAAGQGQLADYCDELGSGAPAQARETCLTVAQAAESAQPQLGILIAGGNPTLGTASTGGVRLGLLPRASASVRLNVVGARLPDIVEDQVGGAVQQINDVVGVPIPALGANASLGLTNGISLAPTVGGFGSLELLGSATWLPFKALGVEGFEDSPDLSWGGGVRLGLLRESFTLPGVSVSMMYRQLGTIRFGDVCRDGVEAAESCTGEGDVGEFEFDLENWSTRAAVSKRLLGLGLTAGVGYDSFDSDVSFAFRYPNTVTPTGPANVRRSGDRKVDNDRWSAFLDASFTMLVGTVAAEIGWIQGSDPIEGFPSTSDFDPQEGNFFGSLGVRISL